MTHKTQRSCAIVALVVLINLTTAAASCCQANSPDYKEKCGTNLDQSSCNEGVGDFCFWKCSRTAYDYDEDMALRASYFSAAAYCPLANVLAWNCNACAKVPDFNVTGVAVDPITSSFAFLGVDNVHKRIWISFRGTLPNVVQNVITDLVSAAKVDYSGIPGAEVGAGFAAANTVLSKELKPFLAIAQKVAPTYNITITGHSLGAALATLSAATLFVDNNRTVREGRLSIINFASPRVGNKAFATYMTKAVPMFWRVTHALDPVVHLPLESMGFFHASSLEIWYPVPSPPGMTDLPPGPYIVCNTSESNKCADSVVGFLPSDHLSYLGIPISSYCCRHVDGCDTSFWGLCCKQTCPPDDHCYTNPGCHQMDGYCLDTSGQVQSLCEVGWWNMAPDKVHSLCDKACPTENSTTAKQHHCATSGCMPDTASCFDTIGQLTPLCEVGWWGMAADTVHSLCDKACPKCPPHTGPGCNAATGVCVSMYVDGIT